MPGWLPLSSPFVPGPVLWPIVVDPAAAVAPPVQQHASVLPNIGSPPLQRDSHTTSLWQHICISWMT